MSAPVLVTGAAGDIGFSIVEHIAADWPVVATDRQVSGRAWPRGVTTIGAEMPQNIERVVESLPQHLSGIVHALGIIETHDPMDIDLERFSRVFNTNVFAPLALTSALAERVVTGGAIVMIGSIAGTKPAPNNLLYGASKAALHNAAMTLAKVLAPRQVRVNVIVPGLIETGLTRETDVKLAELSGSAVPQIRETRISNIPLGRIGTPADIAIAVRYLLSADAAYMTGTELMLSGGAHL